MYGNRDNSANYRPLLQIERLMSDREMSARAEYLSVLAIPGGTKSEEATSAVR